MTALDRTTVAAVVDELAGFLRADGADLLVRDANPKTARIHLALVLDDVTCADCVLPPDELRDTVADALQRRLRGEFELVLDDPLPNAVSDDPVPSWSALATVYQSVLHDVVAALDDEAGIDSGVFSALAYLERATPPHRLAMAELQRLMHPRYSQPGFSRLVQRMEGDGLVERRPDCDDRRASTVVSTGVGRARYRAASAVYADALRDSFGRHLGRRDHTHLAAILGRVVTRRDDHP